MVSQLFFTGGYASGDEASICLWELEKTTGKIKMLEAFTGYLNPSYLITSKDKKYLYALSEFADAGEVFAFQLDQDCQPKLLNKLMIEGKVACHLAVRDKLLVVANYVSGSLSVLMLDGSGGLKEVVGEVVNQPSGGHAHYTVFYEESDRLLVVDLGIDKIFVYCADCQTGKLTELENEGVLLPKGSGPRHLARHPQKNDLAYVIGEYSSHVYVIKTGANPQVLQNLSALPEGCQAESFGAAVRLSSDGKFLYTSNRGIDSIAVFRIKEDGLLCPVGIVSVKGSFPRDFYMFGDFAVVAYQKSNSLEVFAIDSNTGLLHETGITAKAVSPVCICPV